MIERIIQLHFLLRSITQHFDHTELVHLWNRGRHLIIHVFYDQLEFEFAIQSPDIVFHIMEQKHSSIESGYHWNADGLRRSTVVGRRIKKMIIVVSRLLFWLAFFRSEDLTNNEYTWITWRLREISTTFDPKNEVGKMTVRPINPWISRISLALVKSMVWGNWIQIQP